MTVDPILLESSGECYYPVDWISFVDMATAIARIYITDGFTVAADGREVNCETGLISSDSEQKIFALQHRQGELACAVTGTGRIGTRYRLSEEIPKIASALIRSHAGNVGEYAETFGNELKRSIDARFKWDKKTITISLLIDGYLGHRPGRAKVTLTCSSDRLPVQVESQPLYPKKSIGFGSNLIHTALFAPILQYEQLRYYSGGLSARITHHGAVGSCRDRNN